MSADLCWLVSRTACMLLLVFRFSTEQLMTIRHTRWKRTALSDLNVSFTGYSAEFPRASAPSCALHCLDHPPCTSFSLHRTTRRCLIYSQRLSFGINMTREDGFKHYWRIYDECPTSQGYVHVAGPNVCYKAYADVSNRVLWMDAFLACDSEGGHLYITNTQDKRDIIGNFLLDNGYKTLEFKMGGNDLFEEGWFLWLDGSPVTTWYTKQPDNMYGRQHCLESTRNNPSFNSDGVCDSPDRYICQMPMD